MKITGTFDYEWDTSGLITIFEDAGRTPAPFIIKSNIKKPYYWLRKVFNIIVPERFRLPLFVVIPGCIITNADLTEDGVATLSFTTQHPGEQQGGQGEVPPGRIP
jgi:hypothetical protein